MNSIRCFLVLTLLSVLLVTGIIYRVDYLVQCENADSIIVEVEANKHCVSQSFPMDFTVTMENNNTVEESFNLTLYANAEVIGRTNVTLLPAETKTIVFVWWANVERGDYQIRAETNPVFMMEELVYVTLAGDVNNDYTVNILDVAPIAVLFGVEIDMPSYDATYDIDNNGIMNILDIATVASFYGMTVEPQYCVPINLEYIDGSPVTNASVTVYYANASEVRNGSVDHHGFYYPILMEGTYYVNITMSQDLQESSDLFNVPETDSVTFQIEIVIVYYVTIRVIHEDGTAIPNSPVVIVDAEDNIVASGDTNVNGRFYTNLLSGTYTAQVTSASNSAYKEKLFSVPGTTVTVKFNDRVQVTVRYGNGTLVPNAYVRIEETGHSGHTGPNGEPANLGCGFLNPEANYNAYANDYGGHSGYQPFNTNIDGGADVTVTFTSTYSITIHVQDSNGDPISGAVVTIFNEYGEPVTGSKQTDDQGNTNFSLPDNAYVARAVDEWGNTGSKGFTVSGTPTTVTVTIVYSVTVQVRHEDNSGIGGSNVVIVDSSDTVVDSGDADGNGDFQTTLTSGDYTAKVTSSSNGAYKEETFSVPGRALTVTFQDRVVVTILYGNDPIEDAYVIIAGAGLEGYTDENGEINFGCGVLDPSAYYEVFVLTVIGQTYDDFTTNSDGGADVAVYIS